MTKTEELLARAARYNRIERATDDYGRVIGVRLLKPSQRLRVEEMSPNLEAVDVVTDPMTGKTFEVPKRANLIFAASVAEIDGAPYPFPKTRAELDAVLDALDQPGIQAAATAFAKLSMAESAQQAEADGESPSVQDAAKNS